MIVSIVAKNRLHQLHPWSTLAVVPATIRWYCSAVRRSWFAGACLGVALTLALLNPLMCLLHCAMMDHHGTDAGSHAKQFACAMLHHHNMPVISGDVMPDHLPNMSIRLQQPQAFYEMILTIVLIGPLLSVIDTAPFTISILLKYLGRTPLAPPPKI